MFKQYICEVMSLSEIAATEQLMKIALTGQQHVDALIGYYRSEIDRYNDERAEWALHYELLKDNASNKYSLQQQIDLSRHHSSNLESTLNTTKANLNSHRQKYFQMLENSQAVKGRVEESKKRFRDMVAICKPISVTKHKKQPSKPNLDNSKGDIQLQLINLGRDHDHRKGILQRQVDLLKQELQEIISEHSQRGKNCSREYKTALDSLGEAQSKIMHLTGEYFKLRMDSYQQQRRIQEENEILRLKTVAQAKKLQMLRDSHHEQFKSIQRQVRDRNRQFRGKYDQQLRKKQQHLSMLKQQNEKINHIYLLKLKKLQTQLQEVNDKQRSLDQKSRTQINSLRGQIKVLKGRLEYEGVREMRAEMAAEEEQEDSSDTLSMSELENLNREVEALKKRI